MGWTSPTTPYRPPRDDDTTGVWPWINQGTTSGDSLYVVYGTTVTVPSPEFPEFKRAVQNRVERKFAKGKFFKFESSMEFRAWFEKPKTVPRAVRARNGFQQMTRLPNYRGTRTR